MATIKEPPVFRLTHVSAEEINTVCLRGWLPCLGPNHVATKVRSFRSWAWRNCRPSAPRTAPSPDGWQQREGYTGDSAHRRRPDTAIAAFALCLPLYQQSPDRMMPNYYLFIYFFPSVESRRWIHQTADSMSAGLLGEKKIVWAERQRVRSRCVPHHSCFRSVCSRESELCQSWWEPITYAARPSSQSNRQTEKRVTAVSRVGAYWHTLSYPTRSELFVWHQKYI